MSKYLLEYRPDKRSSTPWENLCDGEVFELAECIAFEADLSRSEDGLFRRRLLPQFGFDTHVMRWAPPGGWIDDGPLVLSRDMPESVHVLNDEILSALGI